MPLNCNVLWSLSMTPILQHLPMTWCKIDCTTYLNLRCSGRFRLLLDWWLSPRVLRESPLLSSGSRAEQWPVCPLIDDFFSTPSHLNMTSQVSPTERQSHLPMYNGYIAHNTHLPERERLQPHFTAYLNSSGLNY